MFERFDRPTVLAVHAAVAAAHRAGADTVDEEHLLYGLLRSPDTEASRVTGLGLDEVRAGFARAHRRGGVAGDDVESLREWGIDVDTLVSQVEETMGADALVPTGGGRPRRHIPIDPGFKRAMSGALAEAREQGSRRITDGHLVLAVLRQGGLASSVLTELNVDYATVRARCRR